MFLDKINNPYYRYMLAVLSASSLMITIIITFNINQTFFDEEEVEGKIANAIAWQTISKGVIATQNQQSNQLKIAQTEFAISARNADTLILGSSTLMGVRDYMFPADRVVFNATKNANELHQTISEAHYYINKTERLKWILIGFDWALGFHHNNVLIEDFKPDDKDSQKSDMLSKVKDAASFQRIKIVLANLKTQFLPQDDGTYECPKEVNRGMDIFDPPFPKTCYGFRHDGSATFSQFNTLSKGKWKSLLNKVELKKYMSSLDLSKGALNIDYLAELSKIDQVLKKRGGKLTIVLPALLPHAARAMGQLETGIYLKGTLDKLTTFSKENNLEILDASQSEQFGCKYGDFIDLHHALYTCYEKIFRATAM